MVDFSIQSIAALPSKPKTLVEDPTAAPPAERSFGQWLNQSINTVNRMQQAADASAVKLTTGESKGHPQHYDYHAKSGYCHEFDDGGTQQNHIRL